MTAPMKPLAEVTHRAIELLSRELGVADTVRFVNQFTTGYGDYTAERDSLFAQMTLDQIIGEIKGTASDAVNPDASEAGGRGEAPRDPGEGA